jgi:hypothetical protein
VIVTHPRDASVITAGVDFASQVTNTATCCLAWGPNSATLESFNEACDDDYLLALSSRVAKFGIDVPLGWPSPFVEAVAMHADNGAWPLRYEHSKNANEYRLRQTDLHVGRSNLPLPLSVAADRIAIPTMRAAALVSKITPKVVLDGSGLVCEVYPAAALARWHFTSRGYKGASKRDTRALLVNEFAQRTSSWLDIEKDFWALCVKNDNLFDALVAALVSRAALLGLTEPIPMDLREAARKEGWIAIPREGSLSQLTPGTASINDTNGHGT